MQAGNVHTVFLQYLRKIAPEAIAPHLSAKGGLCAQAGGSHGHVGGSTAGICSQHRYVLVIDAGLSQINQYLADRCNVRRKGSPH